MKHIDYLYPEHTWLYERIFKAKEEKRLKLNWDHLFLGNRLMVVFPELITLTWLKELVLSNNLLTSISESIGQLIDLQSLDLSNNELTILPESIGQLINLQSLDLSNNELTILPETFGQLTSLQSLDLSNNGLATLPESFGQLTNLVSLNLSNNKLTTLPESIGQLINLQSLDLSNNELTTLPKSFDQLTSLQSLHLIDNKLTSLPEGFGHLVKLPSLDLSNNSLRTLPESIGQLNHLPSLDLSNNKLTTLPESIGKLANLPSLNLSNNKLITLPESIGQLTNLKSLDLSNNELITFPESIGHLTSLESLNLSHNRFIGLPEAICKLDNLSSLIIYSDKLTTLPNWLAKLPKLKHLYLSTNSRIETPPLEVLKISRWHSGEADLEALRTYFRQQEEVGEEALYEAKLIIVGEPGAGKTSLTRKLLNPNAPLPAKDESTEGIDVHNWIFPIKMVNDRLVVNKIIDKNQSPSEKSSFRVNIWDFGGQEIYHATHQFFLTRRSLYVVVADAREQKTDFFHWLDLIEHLSDRSPVFIFNNAFQNRHWAINEQLLHTHFPDTFQKPFAFNLADDPAGLAYMQKVIQDQIIQLPHVGDVLPRTWINVRRALESYSYPTATQQEFLQLCKNNGFTRIEDALQLSGYLHDLGVVLHFQDDPLLKRTIIIKPEWGTDAVYRVLDNDVVKANQGRFNRSDLHKIWHEYEYALLQDDLLALMMKFQLCYAIPNQKDYFLAPQLLSEQPPVYEIFTKVVESQQDHLHLRYKYEAFMPKGMLTRLIVAMHPFIATNAGKQLVWRTGVVFHKDGAVAEVIEFYHRREIRIRVTGKNMRDLLTIISYQLDELHRPFYRLKFDKLIPCNCITCGDSEEPNFYRLEVLKTRLEHEKTVIECDIPPFETVQIRPLLDDIGAAAQPINLPTLLRTLNQDFNDDEFRTLCLELSVNYDNLPGEGLEGKQREFLLKLERNGRIPELINLLRQKRPNFNW